MAPKQQTETLSASSTTSRVVLTIAGSDSSGGAGIQVDLRTFASMRVHGVSAITAVTAQCGKQVRACHVVPAPQLTAQLETIADEFDIAAVKIGMIGSVSNIRAIARFISTRALRNVVVDPVLVSTSGTALLPRAGVAALRKHLIPLASVLTPNLPEAAVLMDQRITGVCGAASLLNLGAHSVLLKGGHARGVDVVDYFAENGRVDHYTHPRLPFNARGTGCAMSAAIAGRLALGDRPRNAVLAAQTFLQNALRKSQPRGRSGKHLLLIDSIDK